MGKKRWVVKLMYTRSKAKVLEKRAGRTNRKGWMRLFNTTVGCPLGIPGFPNDL